MVAGRHRQGPLEEALTAAVMQRYHVANSIKRSLGAKMGSLRDKGATARTVA